MQINSSFNNIESLQQIIDNMPLGVLVWNDKLKLVAFNDAISKILGVEHSEDFDSNDVFLKSSMVVQSCGTPAHIKMREVLSKLKSDGKVVTEWLHQRADGVVIPAEVTMTYAFLQNQRVSIAYVRAKDVKKYNNVQELSNYLQTLYNSSFIGIGIWDNELKFVDCNPRLLQMYEVESKQDIANNFYSFSPENQPCGTSTLELAKKYSSEVYKKGIATFDWHGLTKSGKDIFVKVHSERIQYEGELVALCVVRDCTKEKTLEQYAKLSAERMKFMFSNAPMGIAMFDKAKGIMDANTALWNNLGFESKEDFLQNFYNASPLIQPCGTPTAAKWQAFNNIAMKYGFVNSEWMFKTTEGDEVPVYLTLRNMKYEGEDVTLAFVRDLREEKALLSSLNDTQDQLQDALQNVEKNK